jgi:hypothetical protein
MKSTQLPEQEGKNSVIDQIQANERVVYIMAVEKKDCVSIENAKDEVGVSRQTLYTYINSLNIQRYRFPFDRRTYILKTDLQRIKDLVESNR